jgi:hypothetical protein
MGLNWGRIKQEQGGKHYTIRSFIICGRNTRRASGKCVQNARSEVLKAEDGGGVHLDSDAVQTRRQMPTFRKNGAKTQKANNIMRSKRLLKSPRGNRSWG